MLGASMGDPTHDKVIWQDLMGKADQDSRDPLELLKHLPQKPVCLSYYFLTFSNSSDINEGLYLATFL